MASKRLGRSRKHRGDLAVLYDRPVRCQYDCQVLQPFLCRHQTTPVPWSGGLDSAGKPPVLCRMSTTWTHP